MEPYASLYQSLQALCAAPGIGHLNGASAAAQRLLAAVCGEASVEEDGSVIARLPGRSDRTIMLNAHIDQVGFIVTGVEEGGFLRVAAVGSPDLRTLPASAVSVYGRHPIPAVFCSTPPHLSGGEEKKFPALETLLLDTGLPGREAEALISPGDYAVYAAPLRRLQGDFVSGAALDDRAGCAAVIRALELISKAGMPPCTVVVLLSSGEELGLRGAQCGSFSLSPEQALVADVSFAMSPLSPAHLCGTAGRGPMIGAAPTLSRVMTKRLVSLASEHGIPFQHEGMGGKTGTDADVIGVSRGGVACCTVSIPLRYMHTPVETVSLADIENTAQLLAAYVTEGGASC